MASIRRIFLLKSKVALVNLILAQGLRQWRWFLTLLICFFASSSEADAFQNPQDSLHFDSSTVLLRSFPDSTIKAYLADEDFNYSVQQSTRNGAWDRFWHWVYQQIAKIQINKFWSKFFEISLWIFCISAFIYAALKLTGMEGTALFSRDKKNDQLDYLLEQDDIYAINFSDTIQSAINERNFRLATRLLYLQSLRKLADAELIAWKINKTNDVYLHELASSAHHEAFGFLTRAYEYAWYGEMPLDEALFKNIHQQFVNFNNKIPA